MRLHAFALTDPGRRRESNEDSFCLRPNLGLFLVADGMGGHAAGEVASRVAADAIEAFIEHTDGIDDAYTWPFGFDPGLGLDGNRITSAFRLANRQIQQRTLDDPALQGMATTTVALLTGYETGGSTMGPSTVVVPRPGARSLGGHDPENEDVINVTGTGNPAGDAGEPTTLSALVAHVGDSRAYLWRDGQLEQITRDHSWVEEQIAAGAMTAEDARQHPWRNLVTRALAGGDDPEIDITPIALEPGDRVLLCSDGLTTPLPNANIAAVLAASPYGNVGAICEALVDAANAAGGPDNVTVVIVEIGQD